MAKMPASIEVPISWWNVLKTVLKTDLEYWQKTEAQTLLQKGGSEQAQKMALSVIGASIGITEYYIDIVEKIESGELSEAKPEG